MSIIGILVALVIICLLIWAVRSILAAFSIGPPISVLVQVVLVIIVVLWLLNALGLGGGLGLNLR
jgi:hypothetical protein